MLANILFIIHGTQNITVSKNTEIEVTQQNLYIVDYFKL